MSCAAQLVETNNGLVLIDTGYGVADVRDPHPRRLRELKRDQGGKMTLFGSHDAVEPAALQARKNKA